MPRQSRNIVDPQPPGMRRKAKKVPRWRRVTETKLSATGEGSVQPSRLVYHGGRTAKMFCTTARRRRACAEATMSPLELLATIPSGPLVKGYDFQ